MLSSGMSVFIGDVVTCVPIRFEGDGLSIIPAWAMSGLLPALTSLCKRLCLETHVQSNTISLIKGIVAHSDLM
jgi:hypothetical protein